MNLKFRFQKNSNVAAVAKTAPQTLTSGTFTIDKDGSVRMATGAGFIDPHQKV